MRREVAVLLLKNVMQHGLRKITNTLVQKSHQRRITERMQMNTLKLQSNILVSIPDKVFYKTILMRTDDNIDSHFSKL